MYTKVFALFALFALAAASYPGCPFQGNAEDAEVLLHLIQILKTHKSDDRVVEVLSVQKQTFYRSSGVQYSVKFQTQDASGVKKVCQTEYIPRRLISDQPQVMSYSCSKLSEINVDTFAYERQVCAGCPTKHDPKEYDVSEYLEKVLATQNSDDKVTKVVSVTTQVVSGVKYTVEFESQDPKTNAKKVCKTEFISQPWVSHVPQVLSFKCQQQALFTVLRQLEETDPYDVTLQVGRLVANHHPAQKLSKIIKVSTREYNGVEYTAEFEVVVVKTDVKEVCKSKFYAQKYLPRPQVASYSCHKKVAKRSVCAGCEQKQDPTKYDVSSELKEVLSTMNSDDEVTKVISVSTQVVSGVKYTVEFESQDPKTNAKKVCSTVFLSQPWVSKKPQVLSFKCNKQVQKRSVPGAPVEEDPAEIDLTQELKQVMASQNSEDKITKVVSVKSQVVAGMKYTVEFETENPKTHAVHMCKTTFVSAPWVSKVPQVESYKCY